MPEMIPPAAMIPSGVYGSVARDPRPVHIREALDGDLSSIGSQVPTSIVVWRAFASNYARRLGSILTMRVKQLGWRPEVRLQCANNPPRCPADGSRLGFRNALSNDCSGADAGARGCRC